MKKSNKGNDEIEILDLETPEKYDDEQIDEEKENIFTKIKNGWLSLSLRTRVIILVVASLVILGTSAVGLYFNFKNADTTNKEVVVAKDNYRYEDGTLYFVVNNKDIGSYECENKDEDLCYVAFEINDDNFDVTKNLNTQDIRSQIINNRFVFVYDNAKKNQEEVKLYDITNQEVLETYKSIKTYNKDDDNLVFVKNDEDLYGLLKFTKKKAKTQIEFEYDFLGVITQDKDSDEQIIVAYVDNSSYLVDYDGSRISKTLNGDIKNYNSNYIKTKDATGEYTLYDYDGNQLMDDVVYIDLLDNYYFTVDDENTLKIYDYENTKYLEEGLQLYNNDYVITIDDDEQQYAYTYTLDTNSITFTINSGTDTDNITINLLEGQVSKNYKYISYYNGSLYFYEDEEKQTLINSYKCNNPNQLTSVDDTLTTCFLASDTNEDDNDVNETITAASIVPMYNQRFVFIQDDDIINLVDLVDEKVLGTYTAINSYSDATISEVYNENNESKYVFGKNKSGKYGLLKINSSSVISQYSFEYDKLEKLNNFILAYKDGKSYILDYNGNQLTASYDGLIRNYNDTYVKILKDNKYYIYDYKGNLIIEDGYNYVELYDDFVALVNEDNKLTLTDYDGNMIINSIIKLSSTTYYKAQDNNALAFVITKEDNILTIVCATGQKTSNTKSFTYNLTTKEKIG